MKDKAIEILKILDQKHYQAYIIGGYPRDMLLNRSSNDIDLTTNAPPDVIKELFNVISENYGSMLIAYKTFTFEITTFRKETNYLDKRHPQQITFTKNLEEDLIRRDFTINTLCLDKNENLLDVLNARTDLEKKIIKTVGDPRIKLKEDPLRILRAVRFATTLDFSIEKNTKYYLKKYSYLTANLSYYRKKEELTKIFSSPNNRKGLKLLIELNLEKYLDLNLSDVIPTSNPLGIWAQLESERYPFTKDENQKLVSLKELLSKNILESPILYQYGLDLSLIVAPIKKIDIDIVKETYHQLPIKNRRELDITPEEIFQLAGEKKNINKYLTILEQKILFGELTNQKKELVKCLKTIIDNEKR